MSEGKIIYDESPIIGATVSIPDAHAIVPFERDVLAGSDIDDVIAGMGEDPVIGAFGWFKKAVRSIGKAAKNVIKSDVVKMGVAGAAIVFPPVGVPAAAAMVTANQVIDATESKDKKKAAKAKLLVAQTQKNAVAGDKGSQRAMRALDAASKLKSLQIADLHPSSVGRAVPKVVGIMVDGKLKLSGSWERTGEGVAHVILADGMIVQGAFKKVG